MIPEWGGDHVPRRDAGQGMVEYALILGLVSLAAVVALGLLGGQLSAFFNQLLPWL